MKRSTQQGHGIFRKSKAYGLVSGIMLTSFFFLPIASASATEVTASSAPTTDVVSGTGTIATESVTNQATNLSEPQPTSSPEHLASLENPGEATGQPISAEVQSSGLNHAVEEAVAAGVDVVTEPTAAEYDNHGQAQADLDNQEKTVDEAKETQKQTDAIREENTAKAKKAGVIETPTEPVTYTDSNAAALKDAREQEGRVDVVAEAQIQINAELPQAVREAVQAGVAVEGVSFEGNKVVFAKTNRYADVKAGLDDLTNRVAAFKTATATQREIDAMLVQAIADMRKSGLIVSETVAPKSVSDVKQILETARNLVTTYADYQKAQGNSKQLIADEEIVAKAKGADVTPGSIEEVTSVADLQKKAQAVVARLKEAGNTADYVVKKEAESQNLANVNNLDVTTKTAASTSDTAKVKAAADQDLTTVKEAVETKDTANADLEETAQKLGAVSNLKVTKSATPITLKVGEVAKHVEDEQAKLEQAGREARAEQERHGKALAVQDGANANIQTKAQEIDAHKLITVVYTGSQKVALEDIPAFEQAQIQKLATKLTEIEKALDAYAEAKKKYDQDLAANAGAIATNAELAAQNAELNRLVDEYNAYVQALIDSGVFRLAEQKTVVTYDNVESTISGLKAANTASEAKYKTDREQQTTKDNRNKELEAAVAQGNNDLGVFGNNGKTIEVTSLEELNKVLSDLLSTPGLKTAEAEAIHGKNRAIMEAKGLTYTGNYEVDKAAVDQWNATNAGEKVTGENTTGITTTGNTSVEILRGTPHIYGTYRGDRSIFDEVDGSRMTIARANRDDEVEFLVKNTSNGDVKLTISEVTGVPGYVQSIYTVGVDTKGNGGIGLSIGLQGVVGQTVGLDGEGGGGGVAGGSSGLINYGAIQSFKLRIETSEGVQYLTFNDFDNGQFVLTPKPASKTGSAIMSGSGRYTGSSANVVQSTNGQLGSHSIELDYGEGGTVSDTFTISNPAGSILRNIHIGLFGPSSVHEIKTNIDPISIKKVETASVARLVFKPTTVSVEQPTIVLLEAQTEPPVPVPPVPSVPPTVDPVTVEYATIAVDSVVKDYDVTYTPVNVSVVLNPQTITVESGQVTLKTEVVKPVVGITAEGIQYTVPTHKIEVGTKVHPVNVVQRPTNMKDVKNAEGVDINGQPVIKGSTNSWGTGGETLKAGRPLFFDITREDFLAAGQEVDMELTRASNPNITFTYNAATHSVLQRVNDDIVAAANLDQTRPFILPAGRIYTTALHDNGKWENTFTTTFKSAETVILDKDGKLTPDGKTNTYTVKSNKVSYTTPAKPEPEKHIYTDKGQQIDGKVLLPNSEYYYTAVWNMSRFKGAVVTDKDIFEGGGYIDDPQDSTVTFDFSRAVWKTADGQELAKDELVRYEFDSIDAVSDVKLKAFIGNSGVKPAGNFGLWVPSNYKDFVNKYLVTGSKLYLNFPVTTGDYVGTFNNKVYQIDFGNGYEGNIVENSVPKLQAIKDVIDNIGSGKSLNNGTIGLGQVFPYLLQSPAIPMNLAGGVHEVKLFDDFDEKYDRYDGEFYSFLSQKLELKDGKGFMADEEFTKYIRQVIHRNEEGTIVSVDFFVDEAFLAQIKEDQVLKYAIYPMMTRIAYGENITNTLVASINGIEVSRTTVKTHTPKPTPPAPEVPVQPGLPSTPVPVPAPQPSGPRLPETGDASGILMTAAGALTSVLGLIGFGRKKED